jgi:putative endonuclease
MTPTLTETLNLDLGPVRCHHPSQGVIPSAAVFQAERGISIIHRPMFTRHRQIQAIRATQTRMQQPRRFHVYIMTNNPKSAVLYIGITGDLRRRVWQHKNKLVPGFTSRYNLTRLMYYEQFVYPDAAISREKEIKGWRRSKKIALIESMNPTWDDLAKEWQDVYKPAPGGMTHRDPSPRW